MVSSERAFKTLSESHEFQLIWFKNGGTVISQSTVNNTSHIIKRTSKMSKIDRNYGVGGLKFDTEVAKI